jgi:DNA-binding beta-propeller fold protein YncE
MKTVPLRMAGLAPLISGVVRAARLAAAALVLCFIPVDGRAAAGDLYVTDTAGGEILKFTPTGSKSTFASGLAGPKGLAFDRGGNLFVVESGPGNILKFTPDGTKSTFASGLSLPGALAFDGAGNLFATESFGDVGDILKFTPAGAKSTFVSLGNLQASLAFDTSGNLFAATGGPTDLDGGITRITPQGVPEEFEFFGGPAMAFDSAGNFYFTDSDSILRVPAINGDLVFISGVEGVSALAFDGLGNLFATQLSGDIVKITPSATRTTFASGLSQPLYLTFEPVLEKLRNISARALVGTGDDVLIGGFIVGGSALANNAVLARAIGPSLAQAGVTNSLADPTLELHDSSGAVIASNDDWQETQEEQITATGLAPTDPSESAIYATLPAGNYTAIVRGAATRLVPP